MALTEQKKLMARSPKMEDGLDFEKIREKTKKARQAMIIAEKPITPSELKSIPIYINDISRYISKYADQGKDEFDYDCKNLSQACFLELAKQFKQENKDFFVKMNTKTRVLTINWSGKLEV